MSIETRLLVAMSGTMCALATIETLPTMVWAMETRNPLIYVPLGVLLTVATATSGTCFYLALKP